jgi:hypothetical protein
MIKVDGVHVCFVPRGCILSGAKGNGLIGPFEREKADKKGITIYSAIE